MGAVENAQSPPGMPLEFCNKNPNHLTYNQFAADLWWIQHSCCQLVLFWSAELLMTGRWKWFLVHAPFLALAHHNTLFLQCSAQVLLSHSWRWGKQGMGQQEHRSATGLPHAHCAAVSLLFSHADRLVPPKPLSVFSRYASLGLYSSLTTLTSFK